MMFTNWSSITVTGDVAIPGDPNIRWMDKLSPER